MCNHITKRPALWHTEPGVPATPFPTQVPLSTPGKAAADVPNAWAPAMHMGDPGGVSSRCFQTAPATVTLGGVNQQMQDFSSFLQNSDFNFQQ